ncbi:MAG: ethanolamine ammonia-lyase reactivating factor EutA, partial [Clostridia bacterium]|nr:ethanolamine ammonia-lyase reactivating factor EutA [Clostridia bacterium]
PLILISDNDMGKSLGYALKGLCPERKIISIDSVSLSDGDYIDIGYPIMGGMILPVVVKTILFQ